MIFSFVLGLIYPIFQRSMLLNDMLYSLNFFPLGSLSFETYWSEFTPVIIASIQGCYKLDTNK